MELPGLPGDPSTIWNADNGALWLEDEENRARVVIPLVMLEQVRPINLRLYWEADNGFALATDAGRLSFTAYQIKGNAPKPPGLWTEGWSWSKTDKARILRHILKNLIIAVRGEKYWANYKAEKEREWQRVIRNEQRQMLDERVEVTLKARRGAREIAKAAEKQDENDTQHDKHAIPEASPGGVAPIPPQNAPRKPVAPPAAPHHEIHPVNDDFE